MQLYMLAVYVVVAHNRSVRAKGEEGISTIYFLECPLEIFTLHIREQSALKFTLGGSATLQLTQSPHSHPVAHNPLFPKVM
jgi:hypothetical protein